MQRSRSSVSLAHELNLFTIDREYLNVVRHKQSLEHSRKCAYFYERISTEIQSYYHTIFQLPQRLNDCLDDAQGNTQFRTFKSFLKSFFQIFTQLSHFQISELSKCRSSISERDVSLQSFTDSIEKYLALQDEFEQDRSNYKVECVGIQKRLAQLVDGLKKVEQNFNGKFITGEHQQLREALQRKEKMEEKMNLRAEAMAVNSRKFQKELMFHRQRLVSYKYSHIQKISRLCTNAKQSLMEIITYMSDLINQNRQAFAPNACPADAKADLRIGLEEAVEEIQKRTAEYQQMIERYLGVIRMLVRIFTEISGQLGEEKGRQMGEEKGRQMGEEKGRQMGEEKGRQMDLVEQMNKYFEYNECNITEVLTTMDLYTIFLKHLSEIGDKLIYSQNSLLLLSKNVNKQKEITLTILKCTNNSEKKHLLPSSKNNENNYIQDLLEQMNPIYVHNILTKVFQHFEETVERIKEKFLLSRPIKKYTNNSMSMSYIETEYTEAERRPFKCDLWLWREWCRDIDKQFVHFLEVKALLAEMDKYLQKYNLQDKQIDKLSCTFTKKRLKGVLKAKAQGITFQSNSNTHQYFIPFFKIDSIDMELNIMSKKFMIETVHGKLTFSDENVRDIKRFYVSVQKALDYFNENNDEGKVVQKELVIPEQEVTLINRRRAEIEKDLQKDSDYEHFNTIIVDNVAINDVYRVIYSDQKITLKGKQYPCFMDTLMKKFKNHAQIYNPFQPDGPQFYSGAPGVSFANCPLFSQRIIEYDHTLPNIPFMPASCHNKQTVRVFWVSHEQFHVQQINNTSGAPYTENFIITMLTKITRIAQDVEIRFFIKVKLVQEFGLQKIVVGTAVEEAKCGSGIMAEEIKKCLLGYKRRQGTSSHLPIDQPSNLSDKTVVRGYKSQIKQLQGRNKMLLWILGAVLLINLSIKLLF